MKKFKRLKLFCVFVLLTGVMSVEANGQVETRPTTKKQTKESLKKEKAEVKKKEVKAKKKAVEVEKQAKRAEQKAHSANIASQFAMREMAKNQDAIKVNKEALVEKDKQIANKEALLKKDKQIANIDSALGNIQSEAGKTSANVATNIADISSNSNMIYAVAEKAEKNKKDIKNVGLTADAAVEATHKNETNITTNTEEINKNTTAIKEKNVKVDKNTTAIVSNKETIDRYEGYIAENKSAIGAVNSRVDKLDSKVNKGMSLMAAMAAIDFQDVEVGEIAIGAGVGHFSNSQGVAYAPTDALKLNTKYSVSSDDVKTLAAGVGGTYKFKLN